MNNDAGLVIDAWSSVTPLLVLYTQNADDCTIDAWSSETPLLVCYTQNADIRTSGKLGA